MGNCTEGMHGVLVPKTPKQGFKVCVCGGVGSIGQPLCLLMTLDPRVVELSVYDLTIAMVPAEGIGTDLSHIERRCKVRAYSLDTTQKPVDHLQECLAGCHLVLVPAGVPSKGRSKSDLLKINCNIAKSIVEACAKFCPNAILGLIVNPLNSVVPAMARLYERKGLDASKVCGITTLDVVRANKFVHEETGAPIESINVPVIGGFSPESPTTVVPVFSQVAAASKISEARRDELLRRVRDAGSEVVTAKKQKGSATLSMAYAGARFGSAVLAGLSGERTVETAYVKCPQEICPEVQYFSSQVVFGPKGVEKHLPLGKLNKHEEELLKEAVKDLKVDIEDGLKYAETTELAEGQGVAAGYGNSNAKPPSL